MGVSKNTYGYEVDDDCRRLDHFLTRVLSGYSRSDLQRFVAAGQVLVNGNPETRSSRPLKKKDLVTVTLYPEKPREMTASTPFRRLYEDDYLLVIDKPSGIAVHPGASREERETILDRLLMEYPCLRRSGKDPRPGIVHRLDRETSGVLILAKSPEMVFRLQKGFRKRQIHKEYVALARGELRILGGKIENSLVRDRRDRTRYRVGRGGGSHERYALTRYRQLMIREGVSLVRIFPLTGRTHQIRVHMKHIGHPILGDEKYGEGTRHFPRLALHAHTIKFEHPVSGCFLQVTAGIPREFFRFMRRQKKSAI